MGREGFLSFQLVFACLGASNKLDRSRVREVRTLYEE